MAKNDDIYIKIIKDIQNIIQVELNNEKILLATEKIKLRVNILNFIKIEDYYDYYCQNKDFEIKNLISILTNHTTEFFREPEHFDFLADEIFPEFIKNNKPIRIWSAAASIGKEVYSLAICYLEACYSLGLKYDSIPPIEILGTDLDAISIEKCENGIYLISDIEKEMGKVLIQKYFDYGTDEFKKFVRIKDSVHKLCKFKVHNLLLNSEDIGKFNIILIRNIIIYYKRKEVKNIILKLKNNLENNGYLILGHSESLNGIDVPFTHLKNSIYSLNSEPSEDLTRVFVIDDTLTIRDFLRKNLTKKEGFLVVGEAENPIEAMEKLSQLEQQPHAIILDLNMPKMNGIEYLEHLKNKPHPPIVIMSSVGFDEADNGIKCLELGAFDYIEKPNGIHSTKEILNIKNTIMQARKSSKDYNLKNRQVSKTIYSNNLPKKISKPDLIAIGSSTGGVEALQTILSQLNKNSPPIVIVQHIPEYFSLALANRLNELCNLKVYEGKNKQILEPNCVYLAPGGKQMRIIEEKNNLILEVNDSEKMNMHKPSIDYMFYSLANLKNQVNICALILTGMGNDGANGLKELYNKNAFTIAQDEDTCVVFGMPKEAIALGGVHQVAALNEIPNIIKRIL
ncbi:chemotaxis-specific protein-glutamate methyltransferase CheB [Silvanigrella paludirubra]|uniref:protein-glutamate methylesterase n=1 Tax=Silvanigrella paludirubra TaxID=2499159 RepID=A0A6N6W0P3_9BACT|nr:chemotaxis-specific protein-glutamate methyltransferase CheB [Silvanigrella paludirubra]KAB8040898.1 chemotaxis-specific protein-glutamate methyltransferase CheB [Silvanigrella paludirubra]